MQITQCRLCGNKLSDVVLKLPDTPLANELVDFPQPQEFYPLEIVCCQTCQHYQLTETVEPDILFKNYLYEAGHSTANIEHFQRYAEDIFKKFNFQRGEALLDIASNDGTFLKECRKAGFFVLGIDPAQNLAEKANEAGLTTLCQYFSEELANQMTEQFQMITANNVFAHISDMPGFIKGVKKLLAPDGVFSFEVSYFPDVVEKCLFDTIYHEHTSYHTVGPLIRFFNRLQMELFEVERIPNHGGSIRCFVRHTGARYLSRFENGKARGPDPKWLEMAEFLEQEQHLDKKVSALGDKIKLLGLQLKEYLSEIKQEDKTVAIYGMPAKATTLMYALNLNPNDFLFAVDDAKQKQGMFSPGMHVEILPTSAIYEKKPDYLLVLAWNFADSIIKNNKEYKGKWIITLPNFEVYYQN